MALSKLNTSMGLIISTPPLSFWFLYVVEEPPILVSMGAEEIQVLFCCIAKQLCEICIMYLC